MLAAGHLGLDNSRARDLALEAFDAVTWSSSALGCTQPGFAYAAAEVNGYRITFSHGERRVSVHTDERTSRAIIPRNCLEDPAAAGRPQAHLLQPRKGWT